MLDQMKEDVKYILEEGEGCHDWDHTLRVYNLAMHIGEIEGADLDILGPAALLHDIGRPTEGKIRAESSVVSHQSSERHKTEVKAQKICHAEIGAVMAEGILQSYGYSEEQIKKIQHCILAHRYSAIAGDAYKKPTKEEKENKNENKVPQTKEAKILFDADKLDNIGAIGIGRAFNFSGTYHARTHNPEVRSEDVVQHSREDTAYQYFHAKLKKVKDKLFTDEARKIAESRHKYMEEFFDRLNKECAGEC